MTDNYKGPPDKEVEAPKGLDDVIKGLPPTPTASEYIAGTGRRRATSRRMVPLDCGRSDPWFYPEPCERGYAAAAMYLLELGLTPAPHRDGLRAMRRQGRRSRQAAELIAQRWEMAA